MTYKFNVSLNASLDAKMTDSTRSLNPVPIGITRTMMASIQMDCEALSSSMTLRIPLRISTTKK